MNATPRWAPSNGRYGGKKPMPTPAMRRFLVHMQECDGWLCDDTIKVARATIEAAERLGWARVHRIEGGAPYAASITALGRAAYVWGVANVATPD